MSRDSLSAQSATRRGWEQARQTIEDLRAAREIPREEFPGHKEIYCSNLEGFLGGRFPHLLAERDRLHGVLTQAVAELDGWRDKGSDVMRDELVDDFVTAAKVALGIASDERQNHHG